MNLSAPFIKRPVMTTFLMLVIILAGWLSFVKLPVNDLPSIEHPVISVTTSYPGANPEVVLHQITIPLEKELIHVKGIQDITSTSSSGFSSISLKFDFNKNMDEAIRDVQAAINRAESDLPNDLNQKPSYSLQDNSQEPIIYLLLTSDQHTISGLHSVADTYIIPKLSRLEGVTKVTIFGPTKSVWLRLNPELMAAREIGFNEVIDTVHQHTSQTPLGSIQTTSKHLSIELPRSIISGKDIENLKIGNRPIKIKEIGEVSEESQKENITHFINQERKFPTLVLAITKTSHANSVGISKEVQLSLQEIKKELAHSVNIQVWFDKADWITESILDVQWSLFFAFSLVFFVIYFCLGRLSESLITSVSLPLSLLGTFMIMYLLNFSIDLLSLLALTLAVGFVVDDAIVVLENIVRFQEKGYSCLEASLRGSKQISFTILSMTLSLVAVFIPIFFMPGMNGRLFREFSLTLAIAILVSGFISLSLTPLLCSRFLSTHSKKNQLQINIDKFNKILVEYYGLILKKCLRLSKTLLVFGILCMGVTVWLFMKLPVNLIPPEDRGYLFTFINLPAGLDSSQTNAQQSKIESLIQTNPHVDKFLSIVFEGNLLLIVKLYPILERPPQYEVIASLQELLNSLPGIQAFIQPSQLINLDLDFGNPGQYEFVVRGSEFSDIQAASNELVQALQMQPEFAFVQSSMNNDSLALEIKINPYLAESFGIEKKELQDILQNAFGQSSIGTIQKGTNQEKIYLELLPGYENHTNSPSKLYFRTNEGDFVPLKTLMDWNIKTSVSSLSRRDLVPSISIRFSLAEGISPNQGISKIEKIAKKTLPNNVNGTLVGTAKTVSSTTRDVLLLLLAAAVVMYIVLGMLYESFIHPLTILSSIPFAGLGGVLTLFLFDEPISIFSAVGFLLLIGIVKKNGIMMVDYAIDIQKQGIEPLQAIYEASLTRFRPIMMTTFAAIMGAIPIAVGFGEGAEMRRGLGMVIVGGLIFSQILTLLITPVIYLAFEKLRTYKKRKQSSSISCEI